MTNTLRHAQATKLEIRVDIKGGGLLVMVRDDGVGFDADDGNRERRTLGLHGMRERAQLVGGTLQILSVLGVGTMARRLAREEGVFAGMSSGCNVVASLKVARRYPQLQTIVTILSDNGLRYLSTELGGERTDLKVPEREHAVRPEDAARLRAKPLVVIE